MDAVRHDLGMRVPDDVSSVGFDGLALAGWACTILLTIRQPVTPMVEAAIDMLMARVENFDLATEKRVFSGDWSRRIARIG